MAQPLSSAAAVQALKALHVSGSPVVLANIWDEGSLQTLLSFNCGPDRPVWAVAAAAGLKDEELYWQQNVAVVERIAPLCRAAGLPLTADLQDGYGDSIGQVVGRAVRAGMAGANIEDSMRGLAHSLYPTATQVARLRLALKAAEAAGCPDFVLNARCDVFCLQDGALDEASLAEAVARGKAYLDAGATTVFYWGGPRAGLSRAHVERLVGELKGRVAVQLSAYAGQPTVAELAGLGVARISVGPALYRVAVSGRHGRCPEGCVQYPVPRNDVSLAEQRPVFWSDKGEECDS